MIHLSSSNFVSAPAASSAAPVRCSIHQHRRCYATTSSFLLLNLLLFVIVGNIGHVDAGKSLVLFAGPHHSGGIKSIQQFFYHYADKHKIKTPKTFALREWRWPRFDLESLHTDNNKKYEDEPYLVMEQLVTHADDVDIQDELMSQIKAVWDEAELGIILGTPQFDKSAGGFTQGLDAMKRVVHALKPEGLHPSNVTVVMNYRSPRIDQWVSAWWEHRQQKLEEQSKILSYEEFMCNDAYTHHNLEIMESSMNPMGIASNCINEGWNVVLLDEAGIEKAGRDLATVFACDVVNASCIQSDHGLLVRNHRDHPFHEDEVMEVEEALRTEEERELAEQLLLGRDCSYESQLRDKVRVVHDVSVWNDCDNSIQVTDNGILFGALQSQVTCDGESYKHSNEFSNVTIEKVLNIQANKDTLLVGANNDNNGHGFLEAILFPAVLISVGAYQIYQMKMSQQQQQRQNKASAIREAELSEMGGNDNYHDDDNNNYRDDDDNNGDDGVANVKAV